MTFAMWWAEQYGKTGEVPERFFNMMRDAYARGKDDEREARAMTCEAKIDPVIDAAWREKRPGEAAESDVADRVCQNCADDIRARSNA